MIAEAMKYLTGLSQEAIRPLPVETNDPAVRTFLLGDKAIDVHLGLPVRQHKAESLASVIALANRFAENPATAPVIWVSDESITIVIDDDGSRANRVQMKLPKTDVFARLTSLKPSDWLDQKAFLRLLRIDLANTLPPGVLLDRVRKLRFENSSVVSGTVARDRESLGRAVNSKVEADGELPEIVTLVTTVHENGDPIGVACAVDVDASRGLLQLLPLPDEVERARRNSTQGIIDHLRDQVKDSTPIYHGSPE